MLLTTFRKLCHPSNNYKHLSIRLCGTVFEPKTNNSHLFVDNGKSIPINKLLTKN